MDEILDQCSNLELSLSKPFQSATWNPQLQTFQVTNPKGSLWKTLGFMHEGIMCLNAEEVVFLMSKAKLTCIINADPVPLDELISFLLENNMTSFSKLKIFYHLKPFGFVIWNPTIKYIPKHLQSSDPEIAYFIYQQPLKSPFKKSNPKHLIAHLYLSEPTKPILNDISNHPLETVSSIFSFVNPAGLSFILINDVTSILL